MITLKQLITHIRDQPEYDALCDLKRRKHPDMNTRDFLTMMWIFECLDADCSIRSIKKQLDYEHIPMLKRIMKVRFTKKICVDLGTVNRTLKMYSNQEDPMYRQYVFEHQPERHYWS
jgi:hypothetical protein